MSEERQVLGLICAAVLATILTLGLWPFHVPANDVTWLRDRAGLRFGGNSTAISSAALQVPLTEQGGSLEIWLRPGRIWDSGTILAFHSPQDQSQLLVRQCQTDLEIETRQYDWRRSHTERLYADEVFRKAEPIFLTITSGRLGTSIYIDGALFKASPQFRLPTKQFTGKMVVGDSPGQTDSWQGQLFGLSVYHRQLEAPEVTHHYLTWTHEGRPEMAADEHKVALYLFDERNGSSVRNAVAGPNLEIPAKYMVLDKIFLEPFWQEFHLSSSYLSSAVKNIVGFVPFGFCFYPYLTALRVRRAGLTTVLFGSFVSIAIEILQAYLPTRDSGTTDIFTNTLGTWTGVISYDPALSILAAAFPASRRVTRALGLSCAPRAFGERNHPV